MPFSHLALMTHRASAKCDTLIHRATKRQLQSACRQRGLAWGIPRNGWSNAITDELAHALLSGKQQGDHTDSRSWTNSRLSSRNTGSPTGRVRPTARRCSDMRTSRRQLRNRKRSMSWPNVSPPHGASFSSEESHRPPDMPAREPARTVAGAQPPLRSIDPPCPLSSSRRAFFCSFKIGGSPRKRTTSAP